MSERVLLTWENGIDEKIHRGMLEKIIIIIHEWLNG